ncbi:hypothetical protein BDP27DRAFT_1325449 [Rhodocollybia butyracea]|uniref:Uncharacterized protein n=1 Tax=Rhodocollybia butyracea TaxID=206335 RepID=A0A9P5U737_9AGAR|nr:hypothetical protein BDP27DRAFT_1325449 [Rhodocollybia butyracea]
MPLLDRPKIYAQQLSDVENGLAVWKPHPGYSMDSGGDVQKLRPRVRPGDVGCVETDGTFTRLFNIHLDLQDPEQGRARFPNPADFERIPLDPASINFVTEAPNTYRSRKRVNILAAAGPKKVPLPVAVNGSTSFTFERNTSAMLAFFDDGVREDADIETTYKTQLIKNGAKWLAIAQTQKSSRRLEDIILVTGCTRVRSWAMGVVEDESMAANLSLSVGFTPDNTVGLEVSTGIRYEISGGSFIHHGPTERLLRNISSWQGGGEGERGGPRTRRGRGDYWGRGRSDMRLRRGDSRGRGREDRRSRGRDEDTSHITSTITASSSSSAETSPELERTNAINKWSDQCIFIRGFRLKQRKITGQKIPTRLKAAAEPRQPKKDREPDGLNEMLWLSEEEQESEYEEEITWDHMHTALDYILDKSDADYAVVHERDLLAYVKDIEHNLVCVTVDQVLKDLSPEVSVREYNGTKVGVLSEYINTEPLPQQQRLESSADVTTQGSSSGTTTGSTYMDGLQSFGSPQFITIAGDSATNYLSSSAGSDQESSTQLRPLLDSPPNKRSGGPQQDDPGHDQGVLEQSGTTK